MPVYAHRLSVKLANDALADFAKGSRSEGVVHRLK